MNVLKSLLLVLLLPVLGCGSDDMIEEAGVSVFFLDNQSSHALRVEYTALGLDSPQRSASIPSGTQAQFKTDSSFGSHPSPSETFQSLALYREGATSPSYLQQPVKDEPWAREKQDTRTYGTVHFTLTVRDADLQP
ncbi:hypothetical protein SAMN05444354_10645 [Stigmatella aurantiaca]|uniref:Lipoprotein n=1 Tax=Stigmatella aurantiaca TaxID=41 RepID=A0A1H7Q8E4_STIAU|nr:hypothetical protein [Stigmatella aurantiaca]SEL44069.1 hypothetical protein SAMN05444354_10645 [Stigmatella aurantiaca]